jgi:hypothetical protein
VGGLEAINGEGRNFGRRKLQAAERPQERRQVPLVPVVRPLGLAALLDTPAEPAHELVDHRGGVGMFRFGLRRGFRGGPVGQLGHRAVVRLPDVGRRAPLAVSAFFGLRLALRMPAERVLAEADLDVPGLARGFEVRLGEVRHEKALLERCGAKEGFRSPGRLPPTGGLFRTEVLVQGLHELWWIGVSSCPPKCPFQDSNLKPAD